MYEVTEEVKNNVRASIESELSGVASVDECGLGLSVFTMTIKVDGWKHTTHLEIANSANGIVLFLKAEQKEYTVLKKTLIKPDENFWRIVSLPPSYARGIGMMIRGFIEREPEVAAKKGVSL